MIKLKAAWSSTLDKLAAFDWKKLIPKFTYETYPFGAAGIEFTWPWRREEKGFGPGQGLGLGIGLGVLDVWVGWPRFREELCLAGCVHRPVGVDD